MKLKLRHKIDPLPPAIFNMIYHPYNFSLGESGEIMHKIECNSSPAACAHIKFWILPNSYPC